MVPKAKDRFRTKIRAQCRQIGLSLRGLVRKLNPIIRGTARSFARTLSRTRFKLDIHVQRAVVRGDRHEFSRQHPAWSLLKGQSLSRRYGLEYLYRTKAASSV